MTRPGSIAELSQRLEASLYFADEALSTCLFLTLALDKPVFLEGETGVGKTEVAKVLARILERPLVRLQCYEGLDAATALYEWDYAKQLLRVRTREAGGTVDPTAVEAELFSREFLVARPLLQAIEAREGPVVLLVDELDRADEELEAFLLELLGEFQVTVPEIGTIRAETPPVVVITSNRTREIHDALRRRCLYHWVEYPSAEKEERIVRARLPGVSERLSRQIVAFVQGLRGEELYKRPGVAETLDWAAALEHLDRHELTPETVEATLGVVLKYQDDIGAIRGEPVRRLLAAAE